MPVGRVCLTARAYWNTQKYVLFSSLERPYKWKSVISVVQNEIHFSCFPITD